MRIYRPSIFNIVQITKNDSFLLYNTRTTSAVILDKEFYSKYFENDISSVDENVRQLVLMGFLIDINFNELTELKNIWRNSLDSIENDMSSILIAPTMLCNARCYYCFETLNNPSDKRELCKTMSKSKMDALVKLIIEKCKNKKIGIHWFGGEPLLEKEKISYITDSLKRNGIDVYSHMTTNGSLITKELVSLMKQKWNVKKIQITIDGIGEEYNAIKNYKSSSKKDYFSIVITNIEIALKEGIRVNLRVNFDPEKVENSINTIEWLVSKFERYDNCFIYVAPITDTKVKSVTEKFDCEIHPYYRLMKVTEKYKRFKFSIVPESGDETYIDMFNQSEVNIAKKNIALLKNNHICPIPLPCLAVTKKSYAIDPEGYLYRCHRLLGRGDKVAFGYLNDNGNIVINHEVEHFFDEICFPYEECNTCNVAPLCLGGCKANRLLYTKAQVCCHVKSIINDLIMDYLKQLEG